MKTFKIGLQYIYNGKPVVYMGASIFPMFKYLNSHETVMLTDEQAESITEAPTMLEDNRQGSIITQSPDGHEVKYDVVAPKTVEVVEQTEEAPSPVPAKEKRVVKG